MAPRFTLYYGPASICSNMVLYTIASRASDELPGDSVTLKPVKTAGPAFEQLSEDYLAMNWKGHVPVLVDSEAEKPIPETIEITRYLAPLIPSLFPKGKEQIIDDVLVDIHDINYWGISFGRENQSNRPHKGNETIEIIDKRLEDSTISSSYRTALQKKKAHHQSFKLDVLSPENVKTEHAKVRQLVTKIHTFWQESGGPWILGSEFSVLDAHFTPVLGRLRNVSKEKIYLDAGLGTYAEQALTRDLWRVVGKNLG